MDAPGIADSSARVPVVEAAVGQVGVLVVVVVVVVVVLDVDDGRRDDEEVGEVGEVRARLDIMSQRSSLVNDARAVCKCDSHDAS